MKQILFFLFVLLAVAKPALAGEDRASGRFANLAKQSEKIFVGSIAKVENKDSQVKIVSLKVKNAWKGVEADQLVKLFVVDKMVHNGDPTNFPSGSEFLIYLRKCPNKEEFTLYGNDLYFPCSGEASVILLDSAEGAEILRVAQRDLNSTVASLAELEADLNSSSIRVRSNALACIATFPANAIKAEAPKLLEFLGKEQDKALCATAIAILAKIADPESLEALVDFAVENEKGADMVPLVAHVLNLIDPAAAVQKIEVKILKPEGSNQELRTAALLSRLETPEALGEMLKRAQRNRIQGNVGTAFSSAQIGKENSSLRQVFLQGSLEEKKAAAYSMVRWGDGSDYALLKEESEKGKSAELRGFLKRLLKEPNLSFAELR